MLHQQSRSQEKQCNNWSNSSL